MSTRKRVKNKAPQLSGPVESYELFQEMARNSSLSRNEKIGFPEWSRGQTDRLIIADIDSKLELNRKRLKVLDIGCGCGTLATELSKICKKREHDLYLADSDEMLDELPKSTFGRRIKGYFPNQLDQFIAQHIGSFDRVLAYSVLQYVFAESSIYRFLDSCLALLNYGGVALLGDIPNVSMKRRLLSSPEGIKFHKKYMKTNSSPKIEAFSLADRLIDDSVVLAILSRARSSGFEAYILPQSVDLPFSNRREDIVIRRLP